MNDDWSKFLSTRLWLCAFLAVLGFVAYILGKPEFLVFTGYLTGLATIYVTGNTRSKNEAIRHNGSVNTKNN